jgi:Spy/CpxP family protein refolding chaperone
MSMARPNRRPRLIGPFFLIAILLSAGVFIWQKQRNEQKLQSAPPPVVEHQVIDEPPTQSVPPPDLVLAHAKELGLTQSQRRRLDPVAKAYAGELQPLQAEMKRASQTFTAYQESKKGSKQVPLAELQAQIAELSQLSTRLVNLRQRYWEQMAPVLTGKQQAQARDLWRQNLSPAKGQEKP